MGEGRYSRDSGCGRAEEGTVTRWERRTRDNKASDKQKH